MNGERNGERKGERSDRISGIAAVLLILLLHLPAQDGVGATPNDATDNTDRPTAASPCEFPANWRGEYFQAWTKEL
jgi:hypothetical protein